MGGEGSMAAANNSLKNNRNLLKNKRKGSLSGSYANIELKEFPEATPEQLKEIKEKIIKQNKADKTKQLIVFLILIAAIIFIYLIN